MGSEGEGRRALRRGGIITQQGQRPRGEGQVSDNGMAPVHPLHSEAGEGEERLTRGPTRQIFKQFQKVLFFFLSPAAYLI